jgi:hypothetical protein
MLYTIIGLLLVVAIMVLRSKSKWFNDNWPFFLIMIVWFFGIMALFGNGEYFDSNDYWPFLHFYYIARQANVQKI